MLEYKMSALRFEHIFFTTPTVDTKSDTEGSSFLTDFPPNSSASKVANPKQQGVNIFSCPFKQNLSADCNSNKLTVLQINVYNVTLKVTATKKTQDLLCKVLTLLLVIFVNKMILYKSHVAISYHFLALSHQELQRV
jgi:hypothetical protein